MELEARVTFLSDWSIGTGHGRPGGADQVAARDADGLPFVPRSSFRGVLRDAVEEVATALDGGGSHGWRELADVLFGRRLVGVGAIDEPAAVPARSLVSFTDLRLEPEFRSLLTGSEVDGRRAALFSERPAVALDADTGTAKDHSLRWREVVRSGLTVVGTIEVDDRDLDAQQRAAAVALLDAGSRVVRGLGADRRRGLGRCTVCLVQPIGSQVDAASTLRQGAPLAPQMGPSRAPTTVNPPPAQAGEPRWFVLSGRLETPLVAMAGTRGNVITSHEHLPARALLPVVAEVLAGAGMDVPHLLRSGRVRVSPAFPGLEGELPSVNPRCLVRDRVATGREVVARNVAHPALEVAAGPTKVATSGYLAVTEGAIRLIETEREVSTHNVIDPVRGRPDSLAGGVYSYEAIAAGTTLAAAVVLDSSLVEALDVGRPGWRDELSALRRLGSARQAGFGRVSMRLTEQHPPQVTSLEADSEHLLVTASTVVLGTAGSPVPPTPTALLAAYRDALVEAGAPAGLELRPAPVPSGRWFWLGTTRVDGWSGLDSLPRSSQVAVDAGSVLRVQVTEPVPDAALASALARGVGRETSEGHGWWLVDPAHLQGPELVLAHGPASDAADAADPGEGRKLRERDEQILHELDEMVTDARSRDIAMTLGRDPAWRAAVLGWSDRTPGRAQLGSLREALADPDPDALKAWIDKRRKDEGRFGDQQGPSRWNDALLNRIEQLMHDPVGRIREHAPDVGASTDLQELSKESRIRFARMILLAAVMAVGRDRRPADTEVAVADIDGETHA